MRITLKKTYGTRPIGSEVDAAVKEDGSEAFFYDVQNSYFLPREDFEISYANYATFTHSETSEPVKASALTESIRQKLRIISGGR